MQEQPTTNEVDLVVGEWLAVLRLSRVMSLEQVATRTGLSVDCLAALETGWASATLAELARIGEVVGADLLTILLPALTSDAVPQVRRSNSTPWALELNRCAHRIHDERAQALLLTCATALLDREIKG